MSEIEEEVTEAAAAENGGAAEGTPAKKKPGKAFWATIITLASVVAAYLFVAVFFVGHFMPYTTIDGIACGLCTLDEFMERVSAADTDYSLTLIEREDQSETINGSDFAYQLVFDKETVETLLKSQNPLTWVKSFFDADAFYPENGSQWDEDALKQLLNGLDCLDDGQMENPVSARIEYNGEDAYEILPETEGTKIVKSVFLQAVVNALTAGESTLDLDEANCYMQASVRSDSQTLADTCDNLNKILSTTITYDMLDLGEITIDSEEIANWIVVGDNSRVSFDEDAIAAFVADFADEYDTVGKPHTLKTTWGPTVTIEDGTYGWSLDQEAEVAALEADLKAGEDVTREPTWESTANSHGDNDYGDTYVEVNLTAQHMYFYKDGQLVVQSDFVSGNVAKGHTTPGGIYAVVSMTRNTILRGPGYASPVSYWMPFNGGIGLHDATWRSSFGGSIYQHSGSHGCINLPLGAAQIVYENISKGDCVIAYYLDGTESAGSTKGSASYSTEM